MRTFTLLLTIATLISSCGGTSAPVNPDPKDQDQDTSTSITDTDIARPSASDCALNLSTIEGNRLTIRSNDLNRLVAITADSSTYDEELGESHRILVTYDLDKCTERYRQTLPINESADFPYLLADISFHSVFNMVAIKGKHQIYCFDVKEEQLLKPVSPAFNKDRIMEDAQSGTIEHLEVWEDYLMGHAIDFGVFAFSLADNMAINPLAPVSEYLAKDGQYRSLFLLSTDGNKSQAVVPVMDQAQKSFSVNPIFETPQSISLDNNKNRQTGRFYIFKTAERNQNILIDLQEAKAINLPDNLLKGSTQEVLAWAKKEMGS